MAAKSHRRRRKIRVTDAGQRAAKLLVYSMTWPSRKVTEPRKTVGVEYAYSGWWGGETGGGGNIKSGIAPDVVATL
jgi:hypothetical protein